jgi:AraC-like DNA-binding protein
MQYKEYQPHILLQDYISCYWLYEQDEKQEEVVLPDSYYELICQYESVYSLGGKMLPVNFVVRPLDRQLTINVRGRVHQLCVRFYPWGLAHFTAQIVNRIEEVIVPAETLFSTELLDGLNDVLRKIATTACNDGDVTGSIDMLFVKQLISNRFDDDIVRRATRILRDKGGQISIFELAKECHVSQRQLLRRFIDDSAVTPKHVAMKMQFESSREMLMHQPEKTVADISQICGYSDQAHFARHFKLSSGYTPGEYRQIVQRLLPLDRQNVHFMQDLDIEKE